ncbi:MAG: ABC transporter ATP-binding protein [Chloroflexota bacterium]
MSNTAIRVNHLTKQYDSFTAIEDVSLNVKEQEILVLLGNSGCGKTTLLRTIAGLERPNDGEVYLDGHLVSGNGTFVAPERRQIGMVFQDYALFPHLSVAENIEFALKGWNNRDKRARTQDMLTLVGLDGLDKRFPHQLSGGQQQRIALARALAAEPSVVLLDEPFSNLDAALRKFMREEVRRILTEAGATAIFVTHDQEEAMSIADRVAVLRAGRLLQVGTPLELYRHPEVRDVAVFLGEANMLRGVAHGDTVETTFGMLPLARVAHGKVEVMVRPEAISLQPDENGEGEVVDVRYFGYYQLASVKLQSGAVILARVWAQTDAEPGSRVSIRVEGDAVTFPVPARQTTG